MEDLQLKGINDRVTVLENSDKAVAENLAELGTKVTRHETRLEAIKEEQARQSDSITEVLNKLEIVTENYLKLIGTYELLQKDITNIVRTTQKIEDDVRDINKTNVQDHYEKPLGKYEKIVGHVLTSIISVILGVMLAKIGLK